MFFTIHKQHKIHIIISITLIIIHPNLKHTHPSNLTIAQIAHIFPFLKRPNQMQAILRINFIFPQIPQTFISMLILLRLFTAFFKQIHQMINISIIIFQKRMTF